MRLNVLIPIPFFNNDDTTLGGTKFLQKNLLNYKRILKVSRVVMLGCQFQTKEGEEEERKRAKDDQRC